MAIKSDFNAAAFRPPHIDKLIKQFEEKDPAKMDADYVCKALQSILNHVFNLAQTQSLFTETGHIDEELFTEEVSTINRLLDSIELSQYTSDWAAKHAVTLAQHIKADPDYARLSQQWKTLPEDEKDAYIGKIITMQTEIFTEGAFDLLKPKHDWKFIGLQAAGAIRSANEADYRALTIPDIWINTAYSDDYDLDKTLKVIMHEAIHTFMAGMAIANYVNMLQAPHPMARDGEILMNKGKYLVNSANGMLKSVYRHDPEEKVTHRAHDAFMDELTKPAPKQGIFSGLRRTLGF